jgi:transposase
LCIFKGDGQSYGHACYETLTAKQDIILLYCMAHARCYFLEEEKSDQKRAAYAIDIFAWHYDIEREINDKRISERKDVRQELAKPI